MAVVSNREVATVLDPRDKEVSLVDTKLIKKTIQRS